MTDENVTARDQPSEEALRGSAGMLLAEAAVSGVAAGVAGQVAHKLLNRPETPPPPEPPKVELPPGVDPK